MSSYKNIQTIRYMGNKSKLLDFIIPEIEKITKPGDVICDLMSGTNSIGYALKERNIIYSNDIQFYSYVIANCLLKNYNIPNVETIHKDIDKAYLNNKNNHNYNFFVENYTDTYFSYEQCEDIDSLRFAIECIKDENKKYFYLTLLMNAMCKAESTTGHFAQYLNKDNKRVAKLRKYSVYNCFFDKAKEFDDFVISKYSNKCFNLDYKELFKLNDMNNVSCFYLDSPYTNDQYSRFYHILETVSLYDNPSLKYKAKYRNDRAISDFCYKNKVQREFENIISFAHEKGANLVISYSNHGVISIEMILEVAKKYYKDVCCKNISFEHSSQGSGTINIKEVLIILKEK